MKTLTEFLSLSVVLVAAPGIIFAATPQSVTTTTVKETSPQKVRTTVTTITETEMVGSDTAAVATAEMMADNIEVDIDMDYQTYKFNQNVDGRIVVRNKSNQALAPKFFVKLYHNNSLFKHIQVNAEVLPPGVTTYSLEEFGIPNLNKNRNYTGDWIVMIYQDDPDKAVEANFNIESIGV